MIVKCSCVHVSQDRLHGKGNRVANKCGSKTLVNMCRCTVCGQQHSQNSGTNRSSQKSS